MKNRHERRHLVLYLRVFDKESGALIGHLGDITTEGLMVISDNQLEVDKEYRLMLKMPIKSRGTPQEMTFKAISLWSKPDINTSFFASGFKLIDIDSATMRAIENVIIELGFRG